MCTRKDTWTIPGNFLLDPFYHIKCSASRVHMANTSCLILWWDNNDEDGCDHVLNVYRMPCTELHAFIVTTVSKIETIIIPVLSHFTQWQSQTCGQEVEEPRSQFSSVWLYHPSSYTHYIHKVDSDRDLMCTVLAGIFFGSTNAWALLFEILLRVHFIC